MKKLFCMMLAVLMLLTSTVAMAEGAMDMYGLTLGDFMMSVDGETLLDMTGVSVDLGVGSDGEDAALNAKVNVGDEAVLDAVAAVVDGELVVNVDGMSKPLTLDLAAIFTEENIQMFMEELMAQFTEEELAGLGMIANAITTLANEETMERFIENETVYMESVMALMEENMYVEANPEYEFVMGDGATEATEITFVLTGETMEQIMQECIKWYDSEPAIIELVNGLLMFSGEDMQIESYGDLLDEATLDEIYSGMDMLLTITANDESSLMDIALDIYDDIDADEPAYLGGVLISVGIAEAVDAMLMVTDGMETYVYAGLSIYESEENPGEMETVLYVDLEEDGESTSVMSGWIGPDPDLGTLCSFVFMPDDEYNAVGLAFAYGDNGVVFNMYDNYTDVVIGAEPQEDGRVKLYVTAEDEYSTTEVSCMLSLLNEQLAGEVLQTLGGAEGIDIMTITDADLEAVSGELMLILQNGLVTMIENTQGLDMLMGF